MKTSPAPRPISVPRTPTPSRIRQRWQLLAQPLRTALIVPLLLLPAFAWAETAVPTWVQRYNGPGNNVDNAVAVAVDGSNNVIVTGYSVRTNGFPYDFDYATIKYSSTGAPLWTNRYNGPASDDDYARALGVDTNGDVVVAGYSAGSAGYYDYAVIKYSSVGVPLWTNRYNGAGSRDAYLRALGMDANGDVVVTGFAIGSAGFGDFVTIKYSSAGTPLWTNRYNGPGNTDDSANAVVVDANHDVIVAGGTGTGSSQDYAVIKYSSLGVPLWTNLYNGPGNTDDSANAVAVAANGDVIVTGYSGGIGSGKDYATIRYSGAGVPIWTNRYNGPGNGDDSAIALAVDTNGEVIVTGYSPGIGTGRDYATIKYSGVGVPLWTNRYDGPANGDDSANAIAMDAQGDVVVTGVSVGSGSVEDYATVKYSSAGVPLWTNRYNGPGNGADRANALAVDGNNNPIVTGYSSGVGSGYDFTTIKYVVPPTITNVAWNNGTFQMQVQGLVPPGTAVIEASTNLVGWAPVFTNTTPTNILFYADPEASNYPLRFYRVLVLP